MSNWRIVMFLGCGVVPIRLVRSELLGEQGPDL